MTTKAVCVPALPRLLCQRQIGPHHADEHVDERYDLLPGEPAEAFELRDTSLSAEIARRFEISASAVEKHIARAAFALAEEGGVRE